MIGIIVKYIGIDINMPNYYYSIAFFYGRQLPVYSVFGVVDKKRNYVMNTSKTCII